MSATLTAPSGTRRLLGGHAHGPAPRVDLDRLIAEIDAAGLTGRGGAGFPTARKLAALEGRRPVVVGNAMEGEPLSNKDAVLLAHAPGLVLDGLEILGGALRAGRTVLAVGARPPLPEGRRGIEVLRLEDAFVAGQETALVNQLNGRGPVPTDPSIPVFRKGVAGRPTLVTNAETLAHVALIARYGAAWFREQGTGTDPGTSLVTLSGSTAEVVPRPGVVEAPRGTPLTKLLASGGTETGRVRAVLLGGYHGTWIAPAKLNLPFSVEGLRPAGATPGAGIVHVLDRATCPLEYSARIAEYLADQSARQCGPCVNGLPRIAQTLHRLAGSGADPRLKSDLDRLQDLVAGRGACKHPDGTVRFVASTMRVFADHVRDHQRGICDATAR